MIFILSDALNNLVIMISHHIWDLYSTSFFADVLHLKREEQLDSVAFFMGDPSQAEYLLISFEFQLMFEFVVDQFVFYTN